MINSIDANQEYPNDDNQDAWNRFATEADDAKNREPRGNIPGYANPGLSLPSFVLRDTQPVTQTTNENPNVSNHKDMTV